ncbi:hypothetical protein FA15DRAFT_661002 [Coprinopsis marcescibilis]|uniref:Uncharacterized protein n=1 Tax=Coprinopsis marcescibilis TaxID=230819 RepID=A0A5C3KDJ8_COPMA|nr:hypothetical protein FA15DRAFT_661002 [Coprinopsis marcescibilis]
MATRSGLNSDPLPHKCHTVSFALDGDTPQTVQFQLTNNVGTRNGHILLVEYPSLEPGKHIITVNQTFVNSRNHSLVFDDLLYTPDFPDRMSKPRLKLSDFERPVLQVKEDPQPYAKMDIIKIVVTVAFWLGFFCLAGFFWCLSRPRTKRTSKPARVTGSGTTHIDPFDTQTPRWFHLRASQKQKGSSPRRSTSSVDARLPTYHPSPGVGGDLQNTTPIALAVPDSLESSDPLDEQIQQPFGVLARASSRSPTMAPLEIVPPCVTPVPLVGDVVPDRSTPPAQTPSDDRMTMSPAKTGRPSYRSLSWANSVCLVSEQTVLTVK